MALPATLSPPLNIREAITDALYRCILGLDTNDPTLFDTAFTPEASFAINGRVFQGLSAIHADCFDNIAKLDTTHFVTNIRINVADDGVKASMTASALAQHYRGGKGMEPDQSRLLTGNLYWVDLVKDDDDDDDANTDGLWKIGTFKVQSSWAEGDWGVMTGN